MPLPRIFGGKSDAIASTAPTPRPLSDFPAYVRLDARLSELRQRRDACQARLRAVRGELGTAKGTPLDVRRLLDAPELPAVAAGPANLLEMREEAARLQRELDLLDTALTTGTEELRALAQHLTTERIAPVKAAHKQLMAEALAALATLAALARQETALRDGLEREGISGGCLPYAMPSILEIGSDTGPLVLWCREQIALGHLDPEAVAAAGIVPAGMENVTRAG